MASTRKKKSASDVDENLHARLERLEKSNAEMAELLNRLVDAVTEEVPDKPRRIKASPAMLRATSQANAFKARQSKWAKRLGITREEFVQRYGDTDRPPPDMPRAHYRKKPSEDAVKRRRRKEKA